MRLVTERPIGRRTGLYDAVRMVRYACTIFLSALLLFAVQPLIGKYILPWFGGGAGVWNSCLLFFQLVLLAGYAYAYAIDRWLSPRGQTVVHGVALLAGLAFLPIVPAVSWKPTPDNEPLARIVALLVMTIGVPYLALSATGPLVQAWFARVHPDRSPYRLYALSNAGSLAALLMYPIVIERAMSRQAQAIGWSVGFAMYVILCAACAWSMWRPPRAAQATKAVRHRRSIARDTPAIVTGLQRILWIVLPACASVLLVSITARLSEDVSPMPLLWVVPLAVYLLTFIVAFEWPRLYRRGVTVAAMVLVYGMNAWMMCGSGWTISWSVGVAVVTMFVLGLACHGELYRLRPDAARLTGFYLAIALGGALGGLFVTIVAPLVFTFNLEFYLAMFGTFAVVMACLMRDRASLFYCAARWQAWVAITVLVVAAAGVMVNRHLAGNNGLVLRSRNFYGILSVKQTFDEDHQPQCLALLHGTVVHGIQLIDPSQRRWATTYYGPTSGIGIVMSRFRTADATTRRIGVVGLGTGTVAAYSRPNDQLQFYEIDNRVSDLARNKFWFLKDSPSKIDIVPGDARLSMERQEPQRFDILVLDAFNGDAIPVHLLTTEAFAIYRRHISDDGAILVNVSNIFLQLDRVLVRLARELHCEVRMFHDKDDPYLGVVSSAWMVMTNNRELLVDPVVLKTGLQPGDDSQEVQLWTDDHTNLLEILRP